MITYHELHEQLAGRHQELHRALDELVACWIEQHKIGTLENTSLMDFVLWSARQVTSPTCRKIQEYLIEDPETRTGH